MAYNEKILDHYNNPRNVGKMDMNDPTVGTGMVGAPACGDVMKLQIKIEDDVITDAKFKTYGCGSAIASSSLLTEWVKGKTLGQAKDIKNTDIVEALSLPQSRYIVAYWQRILSELQSKTMRVKMGMRCIDNVIFW